MAYFNPRPRRCGVRFLAVATCLFAGTAAATVPPPCHDGEILYPAHAAMIPSNTPHLLLQHAGIWGDENRPVEESVALIRTGEDVAFSVENGRVVPATPFEEGDEYLLSFETVDWRCDPITLNSAFTVGPALSLPTDIGSIDVGPLAVKWYDVNPTPPDTETTQYGRATRTLTFTPAPGTAALRSVARTAIVDVPGDTLPDTRWEFLTSFLVESDCDDPQNATPKQTVVALEFPGMAPAFSQPVSYTMDCNWREPDIDLDGPADDLPPNSEALPDDSVAPKTNSCAVTNVRTGPFGSTFFVIVAGLVAAAFRRRRS